MRRWSKIRNFDLSRKFPVASKLNEYSFHVPITHHAPSCSSEPVVLQAPKSLVARHLPIYSIDYFECTNSSVFIRLDLNVMASSSCSTLVRISRWILQLTGGLQGPAHHCHSLTSFTRYTGSCTKTGVWWDQCPYSTSAKSGIWWISIPIRISWPFCCYFILQGYSSTSDNYCCTI